MFILLHLVYFLGKTNDFILKSVVFIFVVSRGYLFVWSWWESTIFYLGPDILISIILLWIICLICIHFILNQWNYAHEHVLDVPVKTIHVLHKCLPHLQSPNSLLNSLLKFTFEFHPILNVSQSNLEKTTARLSVLFSCQNALQQTPETLILFHSFILQIRNIKEAFICHIYSSTDLTTQ